MRSRLCKKSEREGGCSRAVGQTGDEGSRLEPELLQQVVEVLVVAGKKRCNYRHKASIWNSSYSTA